KIRTQTQNQGGALVLTLLVALVIGVTLASYLTLVSSQNASTMRSLAWNSALPVVEAGIEEAMSQLHTTCANFKNGIMDPAAATLMTANHWQRLSNGDYYQKRHLNGPEYYEVTVRPVDPPVIVSYGYVPAPLSPVSQVGMILGLVSPNTTRPAGQLVRKVAVKTKRDPFFNKAMAAEGLIDMNGRFVLTDSFDSSDTSASTGGKYDISKRKGNGDVASNGALINVNNAGIMGKVSTGPGGTIQLGSWASVGDTAWVSKPTIGIQPGYASDDMNVDFPPVSVPTPALTGNTTYTTSIGGSRTLVGGLLGSPAYFKLTDFSGKITVTGDVVVYVPAGGTVSFTGNSGITLNTGATLKVYVGAASADISGKGVINPGSALNFQYYGLPSNTSLTFGGNAAFTGSVYAPSAALSLGGGGSDLYDFVGSCIVNTVKMNGHFKFHYDEALAKVGPMRDYVVTTWTELGPDEVVPY
ncbi:MAG TPA: hypothetical protein VJW76_08060, partial [Verrucomicrobiae bacterium]|nr:hypothetical protein [Verrucomicrobiae bacterium]